jgi:hypothetical protein
MVQLYANPFYHAPGHLAITLNLNETLSKDKTEMRLVFTATLSVDVDAHDDELRAAFIQLMSQNVRNMSAPAAMLARKTPTLGLKVTSRNGVEELPLFDEPDANHVKVP